MVEGKAYHRYYEGYSERRVWDGDRQKFRLERYYSGDYYQAQVPSNKKRQIKRAYLIGYISAILIFLVAATRRAPSSTSILTVLPTLLILIGLVWQMPSLVTYLCAKELLVARQYRERKNFMFLNMGLACCFWTGTAARLFYIFLYGSYTSGPEWIAAAGYFLDAWIFHRIYSQEKGIVYLLVPNHAKIPDDCYDITMRD